MFHPLWCFEAQRKGMVIIMEKKTVKNGLSMLMKFGSEENLKKLQKGQLYMKNLQYYVDFEKTTDDEDVGDKYDGQMVLQDAKITIYDYETGAFVTQMDVPTASINLGYLQCPVFCMFMFDYRNHVKEELTGNIVKIRYQFTEEQLSRLPNFGSYVLLIKNGDEFIERVKKGLLNAGIGYTSDFVQYHEGNILQHMQEVAKDGMRIAFWKRQKYVYQQEYRILAHTQVDDHLSVDIGDISDITQLLSTSDLLNTYIEVSFKV